MAQYIDPLDSADNPQTEAPEYYGQATVDAWDCVLQKGYGKVPFDPQQHRINDRRTAIKIAIIPLPEQEVTRDVYREYLAEFGPWPKITLPSIKALGLTTRQLNNAWVRATFVSEGRTYTNSAGETKESTTFKFLAVYPDEAACRAAYYVANAGPDDPPFTPDRQATGNGQRFLTKLTSGRTVPPQPASRRLRTPRGKPRCKFIPAIVKERARRPGCGWGEDRGHAADQPVFLGHVG